MKFIKFYAILLISLHTYAIPDFNEKSSVKSILEKCSSSEVKIISNLYVGKDLNKRCLVKEFNKVFKQDAHKNFFAYTDWSSGNGKKVIPEYETKIIDGHDVKECVDAVKNRSMKKPFAVICNTVKGKGVSYMENVPIWHYRSPNENELKIAIDEIKNS